MFKKALQLARKYPQQAQAILTLFNSYSDSYQLRQLINSCTCTSDTLSCTCPPEYSAPKLYDYSGHLPANN